VTCLFPRLMFRRASSNPLTERRESAKIRVPNAISHNFANFRAKQLPAGNHGVRKGINLHYDSGSAKASKAQA
jgi:hypothetical protein